MFLRLIQKKINDVPGVIGGPATWIIPSHPLPPHSQLHPHLQPPTEIPHSPDWQFSSLTPEEEQQIRG